MAVKNEDDPRRFLHPATIAKISRLDMRASRAGAHLVISTSVAALDDVFACCDLSAPVPFPSLWRDKPFAGRKFPGIRVLLLSTSV